MFPAPFSFTPATGIVFVLSLATNAAEDGLADLLRICYPCGIMNPINDNFLRQINQLVDEYRDRCLWFLRANYYPTDRQDALRVLDYIRRYGDREAFRKAGELYQWLSLNSSRPSANS